MTPAGYEWDEAKASSNFERHGLTFARATAVFLDPAVVIADATREADGEVRHKAIGMIEGRLATVVFTMRGVARRIISARRANSQERRIYRGHRSLHP